VALFVDASALVKGYVNEPRGTETMRKILSQPAVRWGGIFVSEPVLGETFGCLARKLRAGRLRDRDFNEAWQRLSVASDRIFDVVAVPSDAWFHGRDLIFHYRHRRTGPAA
jgi:predicted nucleic acid-binding protein